MSRIIVFVVSHLVHIKVLIYVDLDCVMYFEFKNSESLAIDVFSKVFQEVKMKYIALQKKKLW